MAFNLSDIDASSYFNYNVTISVSLFMFFIIPPVILSIICIVGLISTKKLNRKIQVSLINVFVSELLRCFGFSFFYLGVPARLIYEEDVSCKIYVSFLCVTGVQKFTSDTLYAIIVTVFIKYREKNIKWYMVTLFLVMSWIISITMGIIPYLDDLQVSNANGFCGANTDSPLYKGMAFALVGLSLLFLVIQVICIIITLVFIKKNVLERSVELKKVITKVMIYFAIIAAVTFVVNIVPVSIPSITKEASSSVTKFVVVNYIIRLVFNISAFTTPIVIIVLLKPVRGALKNLSKNCCKCLNRQIRPMPAAEN